MRGKRIRSTVDTARQASAGTYTRLEAPIRDSSRESLRSRHRCLRLLPAGTSRLPTRSFRQELHPSPATCVPDVRGGVREQGEQPVRTPSLRKRERKKRQQTNTFDPERRKARTTRTGTPAASNAGRRRTRPPFESDGPGRPWPPP